MKRVLPVTGILFLYIVFSGCLKSEEFPPEPSLTFTSLDIRQDSAIIEFAFSDGDGNFGINASDTTGIFADCLRQFNLYCEYYERQNGQWVHFPINPCIDPDAVPFYYRVPLVEPTGQIKSQKGKIEIVITPFYYLPGEFDTCRFEARIVDRDMNESGRVLTAEFTKP